MAYTEMHKIPSMLIPTRGEEASWTNLQRENFSTLEAAILANGRFDNPTSARSKRAMHHTHGSEFMHARIEFSKEPEGVPDETSRLINFSQFHNYPNGQPMISEQYYEEGGERYVGASIFFDMPVNNDVGAAEIHFKETIGKGIEQTVIYAIQSGAVINKLMGLRLITNEEGLLLQISNTADGKKYHLISRSDSKIHVAYEISAYDVSELGIEFPYYKFEGRSIQIGLGEEYMMRLDPPLDVNLSEAIAQNRWFIPISAYYNNINLLENT